MKRIVLFSILFLFVTLISVCAHTPASFVFKYMPKVKGLEIAGLSGTIWHGKAQSVVVRGINLGQVSWDFIPSDLFQGEAAYAVRFGRNSPMKLSGKGIIGYGFSGPFAENLHASVPAESALQFAPVPVPVEVSGQLDLTINEYQYASPWCQSARGALVWNASQIDSPLGGLELGTIIADLECSDSTLIAKGEHDVAQLSGAIDAELSSDMKYRLDTWFKPGAQFPPSMQKQLKWLGDPDNQGRYPFVLSGKL
ncbi:type II secretion system protein N [Vibrio sp. JC009]|uniref:type II secretion system protein N n=1 Tax=Vibrio sp. JC009 TaxID=2912314 RepID=UPI0023B166E2|nr:type II secretion system protein N [Vibrio sp. JC009]WED21935.1 type II secretion system protein N [Vibrio sp. JC009]